MTDDDLLNKAQRKKKARKERKRAEREAHFSLDETTTMAIGEALRLAPGVADAMSFAERRVGIAVELASESEALFVRKRVNDALSIAEWLGELRVVLWRQSEDRGSALTPTGDLQGFELRLEQTRE